MSNIKVSKDNFLNPTISQCFYCGGSKNELVLTGAAGDKIAKSMGIKSGEMPVQCVINMEPCDVCKKNMENGIMLIIVKDEDEGKENPRRTGKILVVKEHFINSILNNEQTELKDKILKNRFTFMPESLVKQFGLDQE